jgi:alkylation response protein AidB-like acyl-CoA dehydrogenase
MSTYIAPMRDMQFILNEVAGLEEVCALPGNEECSVELVESILEEAAKFATGVLDPINRAGDSTGSVCKDGVVTTAPGFKEAYKLFVETGWNSMPFSPEFGGQGMPAARFDGGQ